MDTVVIDVKKQNHSPKTKLRGASIGFKDILNVIKILFGWLAIDGDVFLESKDWPYLWKK